MGRLVGLRDVIENTDTTYQTDEPVKLFKAVSGKVTVKRSSEKITSDDEIEEILSDLDSIDVEFVGNKLTMQRIADIYGCRLVKGMLIDKDFVQKKRMGNISSIGCIVVSLMEMMSKIMNQKVRSRILKQKQLKERSMHVKRTETSVFAFMKVNC